MENDLSMSMFANKADYWKARAEAAEARVKELEICEGNLGNLLACIHRDGGHYQDQHGTLKACVDADLIVSNLLAAHDNVAAREERVKELEDMLKYAAGKLDDWGAYSQAIKVRSVFKDTTEEE